MKGCVGRLEAHAAFVKVWNRRPSPRGFVHRKMAADGGLGLCGQCHPGTVSWLACIWFLVCPSKPCVYHAEFLFGTGSEVTLLVEVRSVMKTSHSGHNPSSNAVPRPSIHSSLKVPERP